MTLQDWQDRVKALPISQAQLAKLVGVSNSALTRHLNDEKRIGIYYHYRMMRIIEQLEQVIDHWTVQNPPMSK